MMAVVSHPLILVTGLSAVGKTHLCDGLEDVRAEVVRFGSLMSDAIRQLGERGEVPLSMLSLEIRREIQRRVFTEIHQRNLKKAVIIDGHVLVEQGESDLLAPGIPHDDNSTLRFHGIVMVLDNPKNILLRRRKRAEKYEGLTNNLAQLKLYQEVYREVAGYFAMTNGSFLSLLDLEGAVKEDDPSWNVPRQMLRQRIEDIFKYLKYDP